MKCCKVYVNLAFILSCFNKVADFSSSRMWISLSTSAREVLILAKFLRTWHNCPSFDLVRFSTSCCQRLTSFSSFFISLLSGEASLKSLWGHRLPRSLCIFYFSHSRKQPILLFWQYSRKKMKVDKIILYDWKNLGFRFFGFKSRPYRGVCLLGTGVFGDCTL